jgi:alpha-glucosidase
MQQEYTWWRHGVVYQVYPRSFMDSNGDGVGDLNGIRQRLPYLADLGIEAVWISPIYPSPMADFGYDVSDYTAIHPLFGDLAAFQALLEEAHALGLRVILDYVPNHTSDQHAWFIESRSSRTSPKADWYIWRDPHPDGGPPNNWQALFGGSAWEWDAERGQYYLHLFLKEQPDLNWRNPEVKAAMLEVLHTWLRRGVDGFRMDVVTFCLKHPDLPDNPRLGSGINEWGLANPEEGWGAYEHRYDINQPEVHDLLRDFRRLIDSYPGQRVSIGETWFLNPYELCSYYGQDDELHLPFNFQLIPLPWQAQRFRQVLGDYYTAMPAFAQPNFVLGNHDQSRPATRFGVENHRAAGLLLLTLRGTPTLYYGDELGMQDVPVAPEQEQDPYGKRVPGQGRDPERSPMRWDSRPNAGFTAPGVTPWLPLGPDVERINVQSQLADPTSTLHFFKRLLQLRCELPALHRGDLTWVEGLSKDLLPEAVLGYIRSWEDQRLLILINFGAAEHHLESAALGLPAWGEVLHSTHADSTPPTTEALTLRPHEGVIMAL